MKRIVIVVGVAAGSKGRRHGATPLSGAILA
jgi:hypothetical protein